MTMGQTKVGAAPRPNGFKDLEFVRAPGNFGHNRRRGKLKISPHFRQSRKCLEMTEAFMRPEL